MMDFKRFSDVVSEAIQSECELAVKEERERCLKAVEKLRKTYTQVVNTDSQFFQVRCFVIDDAISAIRDRDNQPLTPENEQRL